jgi:uncharacterized DUF497 family protein
MAPRVLHLAASDAVRMKLGARGISLAEARQLLHNHHKVGPNPRGSGGEGGRLTLIGQTDGGRVLTLIIEPTFDPNSWEIVTGWTADPRERKVLY